MYDPFARIGSQFELGYSDLFQRHSIRLELYSLLSFTSIQGSIGYFNINRIDQKLQREQRFEDADQLVRAGVGIYYRRVQQSQGFALKGLAACEGLIVSTR